MPSTHQAYYDGSVKDGVVVLAHGACLPEGTKVTIVPLNEPESIPEIDSVYDMAKLAVPTGIPDLSVNIDHYLYGHPKIEEGQP